METDAPVEPCQPAAFWKKKHRPAELSFSGKDFQVPHWRPDYVDRYYRCEYPTGIAQRVEHAYDDVEDYRPNEEIIEERAVTWDPSLWQ